MSNNIRVSKVMSRSPNMQSRFNSCNGRLAFFLSSWIALNIKKFDVVDFAARELVYKL